MTPDVKAFYDPPSGSISYLVAVPGGRHCAVIDPLLDFDPGSGRTATRSAEKIVAFVREHGLTADWILETHLHEDHLTAAPFLKAQIGGRIATGQGLLEAAKAFARQFPDCTNNAGIARDFDHLFQDGERFQIGALPADVLFTPGHSPSGVAYGVGDTVFVGDALLMPDCGAGRTDLPGADPGVLYDSIQRLLSLPGRTRVYPGHDAPLSGRPPAWDTTVAAQKRENVRLKNCGAVEDFIAACRNADKGLAMPPCLLAALQVNLRAGRLPEPRGNGLRYLELPLDAF